MNETDKMEMAKSVMSPLGVHGDKEFKKVRHRFWRLGRERRLEVIKKMGFQAIYLGVKQDEATNSSLSGATLLQYSFDVKLNGIFAFVVTIVLSKEKNLPSEDILTLEKNQREILYYIRDHDLIDDLIALIEVEEAQITEQDESATYLKVRPPTEFPPTKEELERLKYVPGMKKEV